MKGHVQGWCFVLGLFSVTALGVIFKYCQGASQLFSSEKVFLYRLGWSSCFLPDQDREEGISSFLCQKKGWVVFYTKSGTCAILESSPVMQGCFFFNLKMNWVKFSQFSLFFTIHLSEITADYRQLQPLEIPQGLLWDVRQQHIPGYHSWEVRNLTETIPGTFIPSFVCYFLPSCATKKPLRTPRAGTTQWRMLWTLSITRRSLMTSAVYVQHLHS